MNLYDTELVSGILTKDGYSITGEQDDADVILITGCTVRDHADQRAIGYLKQMIGKKKARPDLKVGLIGCLGQNVGPEYRNVLPDIDLILGPDAYRSLPFLIRNLPESVFVQAENSLEDYDDIVPLRKKGASAWVAISRGCDTHCTYCIVPYMRGKERSRPAESIINEVREVADQGFSEVTLLGQNVNSYNNDGLRFPELLSRVSDISGIRRVRFTTSHPMDMSEELVYAIRDHTNICNHVHLPVQSGSDSMLESMGRNYTVDHYKSLIDLLKKEVPDVSITTDIISGFPGETDKDHAKTVDLVKYVEYDSAFTFRYSPRKGTPAFELEDDVSDEIKVSRLTEISSLQREISADKNRALIGKTLEVMVETRSKRSQDDALGKTESFKNVIIENCSLKPGSYCQAVITGATSQTLLGRLSD